MGPAASIALASVAEARAWLAEARRSAILIAATALFGLSAWVMVMTAAVLGLIRLTGDPLAALGVAALALGLCAALGVAAVARQRRRKRKARQARQARRAVALTAALTLGPSGGRGALLTAALVAVGIGLALRRSTRGRAAGQEPTD
ncbi:hypothetical protein [Pannonibacter tanglangensis]|uniref:Holin-X, holin superfamily III n=1 Tax=Pannonibacter tanglangensis TaxID=2750084 RepID=A0ABW9ZLH4_9HYPH|nr:hypothetical protein [Pannonibacter sp. XCT-34]NBN65696.1 hypothetical protein [Pannonibacter sp. XCT-34]